MDSRYALRAFTTGSTTSDHPAAMTASRSRTANDRLRKGERVMFIEISRDPQHVLECAEAWKEMEDEDE